MESRSVKVREWSLWILTVGTWVGFTFEKVRTWVGSASPAFNWLVSPVQVPRVLIVSGIVSLASLAYLIARTISRKEQAKDAATDSPARIVPEDKTIAPGSAEDAVLQAVRFHDPRARWAQIATWIIDRRSNISRREIEIAVEDVSDKGYLETVYQNDGGRHTPVYQLTSAGMRYVNERKYRMDL